MNGTQTTKFFDRLLFYSWVCRNFCCFIRFLPMQCKREVFSWMWCMEYFVLMFPQSKVRAAFAILAMFYWTGTWDLCNMLAWSGVYAEGHRNGAWWKVEVLNLATLWAAGEMALLRFSPCCKDCTFGVLDAPCIGAFHYFELLDHCISKENYGVPSEKVKA